MASRMVEMLHINWPQQGFTKEQVKRPGCGKWKARTHGVISSARQCIPQAATSAAAKHQCCVPHPEWPRNKAYPTVQMEDPTLVAFQPYI